MRRRDWPTILVLVLVLLASAAGSGPTDAAEPAGSRSPAAAPAPPPCPGASGDDLIVPTCPPHAAIRGDGVTDDTAALQAFLDAHRGSTRIRFPVGRTFKVSAQLVLRDWPGGRIDFNQSTLVWHGASAPPTCGQRPAPVIECEAFLKLEASRGVWIENLSGRSGNGHLPGYGLYIASYAPMAIRNPLTPRSTVIGVWSSDEATRLDTDPTLNGWPERGTGHIADPLTGWDDFTYTSVGRTPSECAPLAGVSYCFRGVSGISRDHACCAYPGAKVWLRPTMQTPALNRAVNVRLDATVAAIQNGWNGPDGRCNTFDDPYNLDQNQFLRSGAAGAPWPRYLYRQQAQTAAGTLLSHLYGVGTVHDFALECGNSATIEATGFGGFASATAAIHLGIDGPTPPAGDGGGGLNTLSILAAQDSELIRPFLSLAAYGHANVTLSSALFRKNINWDHRGQRIIDWQGYGSLTLHGVQWAFDGTNAQPALVVVRATPYGATTFNETGVSGHGVVYQVDPHVNWIRNGNYVSQRLAPGRADTPWPLSRVAGTTQSGTPSHACAEWKDGYGEGGTRAVSTWRLCQDGLGGTFYLQANPVKEGLRLAADYDGGGTVATVNERGTPTDPATYGFLGAASCGGGCEAMIGGPDSAYFLTFTYTGTDARGFTGVSRAAGRAPAGTPVINGWRQQAATGIVQRWSPTGTTLHAPLTVREVRVTGATRGDSSRTLAEGVATPVFEVASGAGGHLGITVDYTIIARDGSPHVQARHGTLHLVAVQGATGASPTCVVGSPAESVVATAGTLTVTWTCTGTADRITARASAVSSLAQTTLEVRYQVRVNASAGHGTVTPL